METGNDHVNFADQFENNDTNLALNNTVLNYYKKFGRKRDLEQYFSLSTAGGDVRDRGSLFWRSMKSQQDSSDSDKRSESATELCRISIKCSIPDRSSSSQEGTSTQISQPVESQSPPIVTDDVDLYISKNSEAESDKYDLNTSVKSFDPGLDTSTNRAVSPTSSITSHKKLEWDSLADVGYDNENIRKNSATSLSTLERLALRQQYTNNEKSHLETNIGEPTAESTPLDDQKDFKLKIKNNKKNAAKNLKLSKKDIDVVNLNMTPIDNVKSVNVNLTKHISFNVDKNGGITENVSRCTKEDVTVETESPECITFDKEIQTTLKKHSIEKDINMPHANSQNIPIMINLNSLKKLITNKQSRYLRRNKRIKRRVKVKKKVNTSCNEKSGEQVSEAESFEYMPGHIYNQNKHVHHNDKNRSFAGNKSSLESSGGITTGSSKASSKSFSKEIEKGVELLSNLHKGSSQLKKKLIKDFVKKLVNSKYKRDDTIDFLTGLTSDNDVLKLDIGKSTHYTTSSTSDQNSGTINKVLRPKKSILRKLNYNTTQSEPNLAIASTSEALLSPRQISSPGHMDTDGSSKEKNSSEPLLTSSEELYKKYLEARKREQFYKKQMADKDQFMRKKLIGHNEPHKISNKNEDNIHKLVKDLSKNNYDGSGDANKIQERPTNLCANKNKYNNVKGQVVHSVFSLSSSDYEKKPQKEIKNIHTEGEASQLQVNTNNENNLRYCCCPYHTTRIGVTDSAVQVNVDCEKIINPDIHNISIGNLRKVTTNLISEVKYVCLCSKFCELRDKVPDDFSVCKCLRVDQTSPNKNYELHRKDIEKPNNERRKSSKILLEKPLLSNRSSQTDLNLKLDLQKMRSNKNSLSSNSSKENLTQINSITQKHITSTLNTSKCVQTDITINPKISEASLSDVNIYNEIYDLPKQRSGSFTTENTSNLDLEELDTNINVQKSSSYETINLSDRNQSKQNLKGKEIDCQTELDLISKESQTNLDLLDEYTLPLKGTNMELKVGIDERYQQSLGTDNNNTNKRIFKKHLKDEVNSQSYSTSSSNKTKNNSPRNSIKLNTSPREEYKTNANNDRTPRTPRDIQTEINDQVIRKNIKTNQPSTDSSKRTDDTQKSDKIPRTPRNRDVQTDINVNSGVMSSEHLRKNIKTNQPSTGCSKRTDGTQKSLSNNNYINDYKINNDAVASTSKQVQAQIDELPKQNNNYIKKVSIDEPTKYFTYPTQSIPVNTEYSSIRRNTVTNVPTTDYEIYKRLANDECVKINRNYNITPRNSDKVKVNSKSTANNKILDEKKTFSGNYNNIEEKNSQCKFKESTDLKLSNSESNKTSHVSDETGSSSTSDPIIDLIKDITRRYSKRDTERYKRRKCFKEIMTVLNYLVDTDDSTDGNQLKTDDSSTSADHNSKTREKNKDNKSPLKRYVEKGTQPDKKVEQESIDILYSSDIPGTSSESQACKILTKIQKQCEEYNKRKTRIYKQKPCETSSSTSASCDKCKKTHKCSCKASHKCKKNLKTKSSPGKSKRKCIAYNLIIQASDSIACEESTTAHTDRHPLRNIIVKVPSKRRNNEKNIQTDHMKPIKAVTSKKPIPIKEQRSKSLPNDGDFSSTDDALKLIQELSVREYLERNRPDFIENTSKRQDCLKKISETRKVLEDTDFNEHIKMVLIHQPQCYCLDAYNMHCRGNLPINCCHLQVPYYNDYTELSRIAYERFEQRRLLSLRMARQPDVSLSLTDLRSLAKQLGVDVNHKIHSPKFISEKAMKKHSEKIYKTLPEVVRKKEERKKEQIKKTNLIMASLFNKNLQKKTLRGAVNLSNYSTVIKI